MDTRAPSAVEDLLREVLARLDRIEAAIDIRSGAPVPRGTYLTVAEVASTLRRHRRTVERWVSRGVLRAVRPDGGNPLVARTEVDRFLARKTRRTPKSNSQNSPFSHSHTTEKGVETAGKAVDGAVCSGSPEKGQEVA